MELRRSRKLLVGCAFFGIAGAGLLLTAGDRMSTGRMVLGSAGAFIALGLLIQQVRPFRFRILPEGLDVRHRGIARTVPWSEIEAIVLDQPPVAHGESVPSPLRFLLIPAAGADLAARVDAKHPIDGRPARVLLEPKDVTDEPDAIAQAFASVSGGRFTDLRGLVETTSGPVPGDFTMVLRGYAPQEVDQLIRAAQAVGDADPEQRAAVRNRLADPAIEVVLRGYDRGQVDAHLQRLAAELAR